MSLPVVTLAIQPLQPLLEPPSAVAGRRPRLATFGSTDLSTTIAARSTASTPADHRVGHRAVAPSSAAMLIADPPPPVAMRAFFAAISDTGGCSASAATTSATAAAGAGPNVYARAVARGESLLSTEDHSSAGGEGAIYQDNRCREVDPENGRMCIEVQFNAMDSFLTVGVAWFVLIVGSGLAMALAGDAHGTGATSQPPGAAGNRDDEGGEYFSPLQQQEAWGIMGSNKLYFSREGFE